MNGERICSSVKPSMVALLVGVLYLALHAVPVKAVPSDPYTAVEAGYTAKINGVIDFSVDRDTTGGTRSMYAGVGQTVEFEANSEDYDARIDGGTNPQKDDRYHKWYEDEGGNPVLKQTDEVPATTEISSSRSSSKRSLT